MRDTPNISSMRINDLHKSLRTMDIDLWTAVTESEISSAYARCVNHKSTLLKVTRSFWFLFPFSLLVVSLLWYAYVPAKTGRFLSQEPFPTYRSAIPFSIPAFVMAGILRHLLDWASQASGLDRAAWVANQLRPLNPQSSAIKRLAHLSQTCHACAAYERQILLRNRQMRLVDLGVMVILNNRSLAARKT